MLKKIALIILVLIVGFFVYAATKPNSFRVERSITIKAPPEKIAGFINDFHQWPTWSPWERLDPTMKRTYSGAATGVGAMYAWDSNKKAGAGSSTIIAATPTVTTIALDFTKPITGHDTVDFAYAPQGDSTHVTWTMYGPSPYISKVMGTIFNMDKMIGNDFNTGLANLKAAAEK